jgi:hypothetical protein
MPRFVVLEHDHPQLHLDLMLEVGEVLWTWQLPAFPDADSPAEARRIFDHRPLYLDYEGPIRGNRGQVRRLSQGIYDLLHQAPGLLVAHLSADGLAGWLALIQVEGERWEASFWPEAGQGRGG